MAASGPACAAGPSMAPGLALVDSPQVLAQHAARMLDQAVRDGEDVSLPDVAARLGVTDRHLRRIFAAAHGVTPIDYLTTQRLLLAKQLLTDTGADRRRRGLRGRLRQPAALQRGVRRALPAQPDGTAPRAARRRPPAPRDAAIGATLRLAYRPPYDVDGVIGFFAARCVAGVEAVDAPARTLRRTLAWTHQGRPIAGWLACRFVPSRREVEAVVSPALAPAVGAVVQRLRQALDLDADPAPIDSRARRPARRGGHARAQRARRLRDRRARDPRPAGHGGCSTHADAAPGRCARRADRHARSPT